MKKLIIMFKSSNFLPFFLMDKDAYAIGKQIAEMLAAPAENKIYKLEADGNVIAAARSDELAGFYISEYTPSPADRMAESVEKMTKDITGE